MKKIIALVVGMVTMLTSVVASARNTDFLGDVHRNYTQETEMNVTFTSSDEIVALLDEVEFSDEVNDYVDLKAFLRTLLSEHSYVNVQADISEDYKKAKIAITGSCEKAITYNKNLNFDIRSQMGMWIDFDLGEEPKYILTYSHPFSNKYMVIDIFKEMEKDELDDTIELLEYVFTKSFIESVQEYSSQIIKEHSKITFSGGRCIVKIDNEGLIKIIDGIIKYVADAIKVTVGLPIDLEVPSFEGIQILGSEGMTYTYTFNVNNKVSELKTDVDVSVDVSNLYTHFTEEEWEYEAKGLLNCDIKTKSKFTKYGTTKPLFPELTEENSINLNERYSAMYEEYETPVVSDYIYCLSKNAFVKDGKFYIPLRHTIEEGYVDVATINYENGVITVESEYLPGYKKLTLVVNSDTADTDGALHKIDPVLMEDGVVYVSTQTFEGMFGWVLSSFNYDMLYNIYDYSFYR